VRTSEAFFGHFFLAASAADVASLPEDQKTQP